MSFSDFSFSNIFASRAASALEFLPSYRIFLVFIIYSMIGWICECIYVGVFIEHKFINRGFLKGPICPVYGCGGLAVVMLPQEIRDSWIPLFICTMVMCSIIEYITGWYLEHTFHMKWWDYSNYKFNIKGRVCLLNSVLFGFMGLFVMHFVQPLIDYFIGSLTSVSTAAFANAIGVVFIIDAVTTVQRLVDFKTLMEKMETLNEQLREQFEDEAWYKAVVFAEKLETAKAKLQEEKENRNARLMKRIDEVLQHQRKQQELLKVFPNANSTHYKESVAMLREKIKADIQERKAKAKEKCKK